MQEQLERALEGGPTGAESVLSSFRGHRQAATAMAADDAAVATVADSGVREAFSVTDQPPQQHSRYNLAAVSGPNTTAAAIGGVAGAHLRQSAVADCGGVVDTGRSAGTQPSSHSDTASSAKGMAAGASVLSQQHSSISSGTAPACSTPGIRSGRSIAEDVDAGGASADGCPAMRRLERQLSKVRGCGR
jgi:hypothetical protein